MLGWSLVMLILKHSDSHSIFYKRFLIENVLIIKWHLLYLIGWVAVQCHWILDESVQYLGESEGRAKYKQDESNLQ